MKGQSFFRRLRFAVNGLYLAFCREHSFRAHAISCIGVLIVLLLTRPSIIWWALAFIAVGLVLVAELINTAIETFADHVHPELHTEIKAVKDIAAAAVLVSSITAILVALAFIYNYYQS